MKKKKIPYHFYSDLYYENFYLCSEWKRSEVKDYFGIEIDERSKGTTISTPNGIIIWIESRDMLECLAHEAVHAAKFLFNQKGIVASNDNDEPLAYMVQWIFGNCFKKMKRSK